MAREITAFGQWINRYAANQKLTKNQMAEDLGLGRQYLDNCMRLIPTAPASLYALTVIQKKILDVYDLSLEETDELNRAVMLSVASIRFKIKPDATLEQRSKLFKIIEEVLDGY